MSGLARSLTAALLVSTLGCGGPERERAPGRQRSSIFGGALAPDDRAVVAIVNFAGGQCSGSLISPELVLTARHCVADTEGKELEVVCGQTPFEPPDSPGAIFVVALPEITENEDDYRAVKSIRMPEDADADLCGTDVVLLELAEPLHDIEPLTPRLGLPTAVGETYSAVGYGLDESLSGKPSGVRKRLDAQQVACSGASCSEGDDVRENEWVGSGGPCRGDSGGPALSADGRVIGVVSRGKTGCREPVFGDVASRAEWLVSEAVAAATAAQAQPPSWAPCDFEHACYEPEPEPEVEPEPAAREPSESCALAAPATPRGVNRRFWPFAALLLFVARYKSARRPPRSRL